MDDTRESRTSNSAATRKRRSSILKSQRPARTPFSELEFNVATPTDTVKSRRVSFSKRTGVAEFVTNEATTTWKNFYEEHNKSLESSGNDTDVNASRQPVESLGRRIFDQQFELEETLDLGSLAPSISTHTSFTAPQNKFELSALTDQQSKLFGNDFTVTGVGEVSGHINVNFSNIQPIGANDDLDEIERDLERASSSGVCHGPVDRHNMIEYTEIDLNMTHAAGIEIDDMSITDAIDKDWVTDKENIAVNPYAAPRETDNFAINDEPNQVLVFDGKRLTLQTEKSDNDLKGTLLPNDFEENPQRKTIVLNTNDGLPNFVDDAVKKSDLEIKRSSSILPVNRIDIVPKRNTIVDNCNISVTQSLPTNIMSASRRRTIVDEDVDISMTESLPVNIVTESQSTDRRRTVVYENETGNISITQMLPTKILQELEKRKTIVFDDNKSNISITQAVSSQVILDHKISEKRKTIVFDENDGNISITQALPSNIVLEPVSKENSRTVLYEDTTGNISVAQTASRNSIAGKTGSTARRRTVIYENETGNISVTQALPANIILGKESEEKTQIFDEANISMTQVLPTNILFKDGGINKSRTIVYNDDTGDISITQAIPSQLIAGLENNDEISNRNDLKQMDSEKVKTNKRRTIIYEDETADISMTQAIPSHIILQDENEIIEKNTIFDDDGVADLSMTQAISCHIILPAQDEIISNTENINDDDDEESNISMTEAISSNILIPTHFDVIEEVTETDSNGRVVTTSNEATDNSWTTLDTDILEKDERIEMATKTVNVCKSIIQDNDVIMKSDKNEKSININNKVIDIPLAQTVPPNVFLLSGIVSNSDESVTTERKVEETIENQMNDDVCAKQDLETVALADAEGDVEMSITQAIRHTKIQNIIQQCNKSITKTFDSNLSLTKPIPSDLIAIQTGIFNKSINKKLDTLEIADTNQNNDVMVYQAVTSHSLPKLNRNQQGDANNVLPADDNDSSITTSTRVDTDVTESLSSKVCSDSTLNMSKDNVGHKIEPKLEKYDMMNSESAGTIVKTINSKEDVSVKVEQESAIHTLLDMTEPSVESHKISENNSVNTLIHKLDNKLENKLVHTLDNISNDKFDNISKKSVSMFNKSDTIPVYKSVVISDNVSVNKSDNISEKKSVVISDNISSNIPDSKSSITPDNKSKNKSDNISVKKSVIISDIVSDNKPESIADNVSNDKSDNISVKKSVTISDNSSVKIPVNDKPDNVSINKSAIILENTSPKIPDNLSVNASGICNKSENNADNQSEKLSKDSSMFYITEDVDNGVQTDDKIEDNKENKHLDNKLFELMDRVKGVFNRNKSPEKSNEEDVKDDENLHQYSFEQANDTKELLGMISSLTDKTQISSDDKAISAVAEDKAEPHEPKRLSFATKRQSIVISREDLLNNISMAQAALQKSKVCFDESSLTEDGIDTSCEDLPSISNKSTRTSSEVVKTLHFDESASEGSMKSDFDRSSPLKKATYDDSSAIKDNKAYVIPSYLKDVSDGVKELMLDLVKPVTDVIPFESCGELRKAVSQVSTQIQANLTTSSQIDLESELTSRPCSQDNMDRLPDFTRPGILKSSDRQRYSSSSERTFEYQVEGNYGRQEQVIVFDRENPLNNVLLPLDYAPAHEYHPMQLDHFTNRSDLTLCGSDRSASCQINMEVDSNSVDTESNGNQYSETQTQFRVSARIPFEYQKNLSREQDIEKVTTKSKSPVRTVFNDKAVDASKNVESSEVNTVIAMRGNNELLESNSSLTLMDDDTSRSESICSSPQLRRSPVRAIFNIEEQDEMVKSTKSEKMESDIASIDSDMDNLHRGKKRSHKPRTPNNKISADITPKPLSKMQKTSKHSPIKKLLQLNRETSRVIAERDTDLPENRHVVNAKHGADKSINKSPKSKHDSSITIQQLIAEYKIDTNKEILDAIKDLQTDVTMDASLSKSDVGSRSLASFTSSKNVLGVKHEQIEATSADLNSHMPVHRLASSSSEWHPLSCTSSKSMSECHSGANIVSKIDMLPFMGSYECERETTSADTWSFLLLHGRIRLTIRLAHRVDNSVRTHVRADTAVTDITVQTVKFDNKNPVAHLCIRFARDTMRYMVDTLCERTVLARDTPPLLKRCAAVARVALRWGRAMHDAKMHLAYTVDSEGHLQLKVANIPQRSVWEVSMDLVLVLADPKQAPWPRAVNVRVTRVVSDVEVTQDDIRRALKDTSKDWGHAPKTLWRMFRFLKNKPQYDNILSA